MFQDRIIRRNGDYPFVNILNPGDHDYPVGREHFWDCGAAAALDEGLYRAK